MRVILARGGGVAGLRKPPIELDTEALASAPARQLRALVEGALAASRTPGVALRDQADHIGYTLTIIDDAGAPQTIEVLLPAAPPAVRALIAEIRRLAEAR